ncbi:MAG: amidohydrolase [Gammaproteobacteria bacterium]|nr:amidohydrolase [Gammaproteobacteria bacterium]MDH3412383.1 amidohydrolase [Gammaproteobacteria bacterium]
MTDWDPEGERLPVKLDATSNGEFAPIPLSREHHLANEQARAQATVHANRRGMKRRAFMVSACGAASTLLAFNRVNAASGKTGGFFQISEDAALDPELAAAELEGQEFIFDVQGHFVGEHGLGRVGLGSAENFIKDVFLDSDTDMMVLSFIPSRREKELLTIAEADGARQVVARMQGSHRLLIHGRVNPNQPGDLEDMDELAERWGVSAWKTYTQWGPKGKGFFMHDEDTGLKLIEKARALGVKNICIHKGLPFGRESYEHSLCSDIGVVARRYPDVNFLIYHSGFIPGQSEGPYNPRRGEGVDELIRSVLENDVRKNANVYAELGSTWRYLLRDPDNAAHTIGKLLKYMGEDNVLWGTDSIWYGSPQDQIQAFRTFQISQAFQEKFGYPAITPELRAKIFGLNATRPYRVESAEVLKRARSDEVYRQRLDYRQTPNPHYLTYGPKTRRAFLRLRRLSGGQPA